MWDFVTTVLLFGGYGVAALGTAGVIAAALNEHWPYAVLFGLFVPIGGVFVVPGLKLRR